MVTFSLQRVLDLRKRREEAMAVRLAAARAAAEEARRSAEELETQRQESLRQRPAAGGTVGQLQNSSYVIERIDARLVDAREAVRAADAAVKARLAEFNDAMQDRRVLDRLKEKRMEEAMAEEIRIDQTNMDAVALTRFVRTDNGNGEGDR